jgi:hypothetical protein
VIPGANVTTVVKRPEANISEFGVIGVVGVQVTPAFPAGKHTQFVRDFVRDETINTGRDIEDVDRHFDVYAKCGSRHAATEGAVTDADIRRFAGKLEANLAT